MTAAAIAQASSTAANGQSNVLGFLVLARRFRFETIRLGRASPLAPWQAAASVEKQNGKSTNPSQDRQ
jgi:hypothetical protein